MGSVNAEKGLAEAGERVLVSVVRVPARVAAALQFGEGSILNWISDALGSMFAGDLDDDGNGGAWSDEVRARFGVTNADECAFDATAAGFLDADGKEARAVAAILAGRAVCFPDADGMRGEAGRPSHNGNDGGGRRLGGFEKGFCMAPDFDSPLAEDADGHEAKGGVDD